MALKDDRALLHAWLDLTVRYLWAASRHPRLAVRGERALFVPAIAEFEATQLLRIREAIDGLSARQLEDAGLSAAQLRTKVALNEVSRIEVEEGRSVDPDELEKLLDHPYPGSADPTPPDAPEGPLSSLRRWAKRARIILDSLKNDIPLGHALVELLDFADTLHGRRPRS